MPSKKLILSDIGEFNLISNLMRKADLRLPSQLIGAGDDAAVVPFSWLNESDSAAKGYLVVSSDIMVENKDFRLSYFSGSDLGQKLLAVNLSDLAAMGAKPKAFIINLQAPACLDSGIVEQIYLGLQEMSRSYGVYLLGGDTSEANDFSLGLTVLGYSEQMPLLRKGSKSGDDIWVSGTLGMAHLGFMLLENALPADYESLYTNSCVRKFLTPQPRVELGMFLLQSGIANCAIDISDGLLQDLGHILRSSEKRAEILVAQIPADTSDPYKLTAMSAGEDFELLFTASADKRGDIQKYSEQSGLALSLIGRVSDLGEAEGLIDLVNQEGDKRSSPEQYFANHNRPFSSGFSHFKVENR